MKGIELSCDENGLWTWAIEWFREGNLNALVYWQEDTTYSTPQAALEAAIKKLDKVSSNV